MFWRNSNLPKEVLNRHLFLGVLVFGMMGAARGVDEGLAGTIVELPSFQRQFGLKDPSMTASQQANRLSNITSMVQLGSILGAMVGFYITDKVGRMWASRELCIVWMLGISLYLGAAANGILGLVYAGRFIAGVGIGQTTVVGPLYLAEISPGAVRGFCVCVFAGCAYLGLMLGYFSAWGSSLHISANTSAQWVVPNCLHLYFAVIIFCLTWTVEESPRWLMKVGRIEESICTLSKLRGLPRETELLQREASHITSQISRQQEATMGATGFGMIKELFLIRANRYRIMLSVLSQLLAQWSGANSITIYAPEYFSLVGQSGQNEKLFATAILGIVKFVSAMTCAIFLVDFIGRKRALSIGICIQLVAMLYMAIFLTIYSTLGDEGVGQDPPPNKHATLGAIVMIYLSGFGWALGWNSIQYLINSEIYPLRLRALGGSIAMTIHFANQYGNTKAVPSMFLGLGHGGTLFFFVGITIVGLVWVWFFIPETAGKSLEAIDAIFNLPWYLVGRKGGQLIVDQDEETADAESKVEESEKPEVQHEENHS